MWSSFSASNRSTGNATMVSASASGDNGARRSFTFFQNARGGFDCPVDGCGKSYPQPDNLKYHISNKHVYPVSQTPTYQPPNRPQAPRNVPPLSPPINNNDGTSHGPVNLAQSPVSPVVQLTTASRVKSRSPLSRNQPLSIPHNAQEAATPFTWDQYFVDPQKTTSLIKSFIISYYLLGKPHNTMEHNKIFNMYGDFYNNTQFVNGPPAFDDEVLWNLFKLKVDEIQKEMLTSGETYRTKEGLKLARFPSQPPQSYVGPQSIPISTPPTTPILPNDTYTHCLKLWQALDANAQAKLFREQIRCAKGPQSLFVEWEEFAAETRRKGSPGNDNSRRESEVIDLSSLSRSGTSDGQVESPKKLQVLTPLETPPPRPKVESKDLKSMLESRLKEAKLKRQRAKEAEKEGEERAGKKQRGELT